MVLHRRFTCFQRQMVIICGREWPMQVLHLQRNKPWVPLWLGEVIKCSVCRIISASGGEQQSNFVVTLCTLLLRKLWCGWNLLLRCSIDLFHSDVDIVVSPMELEPIGALNQKSYATRESRTFDQLSAIGQRCLPMVGGVVVKIHQRLLILRWRFVLPRTAQRKWEAPKVKRDAWMPNAIDTNSHD